MELLQALTKPNTTIWVFLPGLQVCGFMDLNARKSHGELRYHSDLHSVFLYLFSTILSRTGNHQGLRHVPHHAARARWHAGRRRRPKEEAWRSCWFLLVLVRIFKAIESSKQIYNSKLPPEPTCPTHAVHAP